MNRLCLLTGLLALMTQMSPLHAATEQIENISPGDITRQVARKPKHLFPFMTRWQATSAYLKDEKNLDISLAMTTLRQYSKAGMPSQQAAAGDWDIISLWTPYNTSRSATLFGAHLEQRVKFMRITPSQFNTMINSAAKTTRGFNHFRMALTELWWGQRIIKEVIGFRIGKLNLLNLVDNYAFQSQKFYFINEVFSGNPGVDMPDNPLGVVVGFEPIPHYYARFGLGDTNGSKTTSGFNTFFNDSQFFKSFELGYYDTLIPPFTTNYHLFLWQSAPSTVNQKPSDQGISVTLQHKIKKRFMPFLRLAQNKGRATRLKRLIATGVGIHHPFNELGDWLGIGLSYASPSDNALSDETIIEVFYRNNYQNTIEITPDIQLINLRSVAQKRHWVGVASLRFRLQV